LIGRKRHADGSLVGLSNKNPKDDYSVYEVQLNDGSYSEYTAFWSSLTTVKHSMPIELAEYAIANKINDEPAFAWSVTRTFRRRNNIIKSTRIPKKLMKYGIKVPGSFEQAYAFDIENGKQLWTGAINKELRNVIVAFNLLEMTKNCQLDRN